MSKLIAKVDQIDTVTHIQTAQALKGGMARKVEEYTDRKIYRIRPSTTAAQVAMRKTVAKLDIV